MTKKLLILALLFTFALTGQAHASSASKFKVQIVPLGCQFTVIDTGTNEIEYLTPEECGQVITPPPGSGIPTEEKVAEGIPGLSNFPDYFGLPSPGSQAPAENIINLDD
ncbi:MAG: hypothetical protein ACRD4B_05670, partial [Acidobacteriota bacterium]